MFFDGEVIVIGVGDEIFRFWNVFSKIRLIKVSDIFCIIRSCICLM